jgi:hypothetical protein
MATSTLKVLFDTDIGSDIDDAVALAYLLAQPRCRPRLPSCSTPLSPSPTFLLNPAVIYWASQPFPASQSKEQNWQALYVKLPDEIYR